MAKDYQKGGGVLSSLRSLLSTGEEEPASATQMLREDHQKVESLFQEFESADKRRKGRIAEEVVAALTAHTTIEEEIFYPAVTRVMDEKQRVECAFEEHALAKKLIEELRGMQPGAEHFEAKFQVLTEVVRHHVREEESQILPAADSSDLDLQRLGEQMRERKEEVMSGGGRARGSRGRRSSGRSSQAKRGAARGRTARSNGGRRSGEKKSQARGRGTKGSAASKSRAAGGRSGGGRSRKTGSRGKAKRAR
ncbi:MAG TPA: hemerythrin domain-containing protein [Candidatus Binatia bacterium]|nr:hemerythrin domain-containing protein [Candidatus Binatia bacterium]